MCQCHQMCRRIDIDVNRHIKRSNIVNEVFAEMALWGLEEGDGLLLSSLLVVLRVPGILLLDLWWSEHTKDILPEAAEAEAVADMGISLLILMLVSFRKAFT